MKAQAIAPFVLNGKVVAAGETVDITEEQFYSVRGSVEPVQPKGIGINELMTAMELKLEKKVIEKPSPKVETKVVEKAPATVEGKQVKKPEKKGNRKK